MVRHVPWDEMPKHYAPNRKELIQEAKIDKPKAEVSEVRNFERDIREIGTRTLFGVVVRYILTIFISIDLCY
jgi:hypothetical protein